MIHRSSHPRRATPQDDATLRAEGIERKGMNGYTRIPNSILLPLIRGEFSKHEMQVLLCIVRATIGEWKQVVPLSKSAIGRLTGIQGSSGRQALNALEAGGVIRKTPGNESEPSKIGLCVTPELWKMLQISEESLGQISPPGGINPRDISTPASQGGIHPPLNNKNKYIKNSLSQLPTEIREHLEAIRTPRKRESETHAYRELRESFSDSEISACLRWVQTEGALGSGETHQPCHSPMAYLAKAMTEVLSRVKAADDARKQAQERENAARASAQAETERESQEAAEWAQREAAFARAHPSAELEHQAIAKLCAGLPFSPASPLGRATAISRWWAGLSAGDRAAGSSMGA